MRKVSYENHRVTVYPESPWIATNEETRLRHLRELCADIAKEVRRHIDHVGVVLVEFDTVKTCEHCGSAWTEDSAEYNGGCCDKDEAAKPEDNP